MLRFRVEDGDKCKPLDSARLLSEVHVGSVRAGNFGWARTEAQASEIFDHDTSSPVDLAKAVADELARGHAVALGFECPLFVPVPTDAKALGQARIGEGNRPWSAGAGAGALATGLVQTTWVLSSIRSSRPEQTLQLDWGTFAARSRGLLLREAFVSAKAKGKTHTDDAKIAVAAFSDALPDSLGESSVTAERAVVSG